MAKLFDSILTLYIWYLPIIIFRTILHIIIQCIVMFFANYITYNTSIAVVIFLITLNILIL